MKKKYIALIDSGVGGLSVLKRLTKDFPNENYLYLGDNSNAPYGNKSIRELKKLVFEKILLLNDYNVKFLVVACNTLSINLISFIKEICPYPVYGIYPPIEYNLIRKNKVMLLATNKTVENYSRYDIVSYPLNNLAKDIENNLFMLDIVQISNHIKKMFLSEYVIVLGCTHYFFVKNKIRDHFLSNKLCCSEDFVKPFFSEIIDNSKTLDKNKRNNILFTGNDKEINKEFWGKVVKSIRF